jgi:3-methyladenine DNA glycosylase AlkD
MDETDRRTPIRFCCVQDTFRVARMCYTAIAALGEIHGKEWPDMTTAQEVLAELEALGNEQTRKTYRRHGISGEIYGVSYANLGALRKRLKINHTPARQLWDSGNHDARILATMIADPAQADEQLITAWAGDLRDHVLTDALVGFVSKTGAARTWTERWINTNGEWTARAGWHVLGQLAMNDPALPDTFFERYLARIERDIGAEKNRVRQAMNNALIAIGMRSDALEARALAVAKAIGKVNVDHGDTSCKTPDASSYIRKGRERQRLRAAQATPA